VADVPWWVVVVFGVGVALTAVFGRLGQRWERVGDWYEGASFAAFVPMAVSTFTGSVVLFAIAAVGFLVLGAWATYQVLRSSAGGRVD